MTACVAIRTHRLLLSQITRSSKNHDNSVILELLVAISPKSAIAPLLDCVCSALLLSYPSNQVATHCRRGHASEKLPGP